MQTVAAFFGYFSAGVVIGLAIIWLIERQFPLAWRFRLNSSDWTREYWREEMNKAKEEASRLRSECEAYRMRLKVIAQKATSDCPF